MKNNKDILFTFDYELFLGQDSGTVDNCLIIPTNKILSVLNKYNVKGIFFVDTLYLSLLSKFSKSNIRCKKDLDKIEKQLVELLKEHHHVYPHIHPHWLDAIYIEKSNTWSLNKLDKYMFSNLLYDEREYVFNESINYLKQLYYRYSIKEDFSAYRAGGWCIQPFSEFTTFFNKHNIQNDFSVLSGSEKDTNSFKFDFSSVKINQFPYNFQNEVTKEEKKGKYKEYPISSIKFNKKSIINKVSEKVLWRIKHGQNFGNGKGVRNISNIEPTKYDNELEMVSIELLTLTKLKKYLEFINVNDYMQFISHPKMISPHNILMLDVFLSSISNKYRINYDWKKIEF
jgi:hypothetical protein